MDKYVATLGGFQRVEGILKSTRHPHMGLHPKAEQVFTWAESGIACLTKPLKG